MESMTKWVDIESCRDRYWMNKYPPYGMVLAGLIRLDAQLGTDLTGWGRWRDALVPIAEQYHESLGFPARGHWYFHEECFRTLSTESLNELREFVEMIQEGWFFEEKSDSLSSNNIEVSSFVLGHLTRMHNKHEGIKIRDRRWIEMMSKEEKASLAREHERSERARLARARGMVICTFCGRMWGPLRNKAGKIMRSEDVYVICPDCEEIR